MLDALVEQGGAIRADGGLVYLTAKAVGAVTRTVINHTGITEAKTLSTGKDGKIYLMGGMEKDRIAVKGKLDASAPNGGNGGFVETSAAHVQIADEVQLTTAAPKGKAGTWLIDPQDFNVWDGNFAQASDGIGTTTLGNALRLSNVTIQTAEGSGGNGDIFVTGSVTKTTGAVTTLTLAAHRDIIIRNNGGIRSGIFGSPGSPLNIVLSARATGLSDGNILLGDSSLLSFGGDITIGGGNLQASGYAKGRNGYAGVFMLDNTIDATGNGASQGASGAAGFNGEIPTSAEGGNIVIEGRGGTAGDYNNSDGGIYMQGSSVMND